MKSFSDASFFRVFELMVAASNPGLKMSHWTIDNVSVERDRHSFSGRTYGFAIEVFTLSRSDRRSWRLIVTNWRLIVTKEYWWNGSQDRPLRTVRWGRVTSGSRTEALAWFRATGKTLEQSAPGQT